MKRKEKKIVFHKEKIIGVLIVCAVFLLSIGFSESSIDLGIDSLAAAVRIQKDIRVTGISMTSTSNDALSNWEDYNYDNVTAGVTLPNADSTVTYEIEITNIGNIESMIDSITGLDSHLEIKSINGYTLKTAVCDDNDSTMCKLGAVKHFTITIGYKSGEYNSNSTDFSIMMNMNFAYLSDKVAKAGDSYYDTLQLAINSVQANDPDQTLIVLLKNTNENVQIDEGKNIYLDMKDKTLTCVGNNNAVKNYGTLTIKNGNINCAASTNGAVNNYETGTITIDGTRIISTGGRQAFWNDRGASTITGNAYFYSQSNARAAVHNVGPGSMFIESGTIISDNFVALRNEKKAGAVDCVLIIGNNDGIVHNDKPFIQSNSTNVKHYAVQSDYDFMFYDGILKSIAPTVNSTSRLKPIDDWGTVNYLENIDGNSYHVTTLGFPVKVTFVSDNNQNSPNGSFCSFKEITIEQGDSVGELPICSKSGHNFVEFNTKADGSGTTYTVDTPINEDVRLYPIFEKTSEVARIGTDPHLYDTLSDAINAAPNDGTVVDIYLLKDITEYLFIASTKNIVFHLSDKTLTSIIGVPLMVNNGNITISDGNFFSQSEQSIINHVAGTLNITGGHFEINSSRQVIYITGGTVNISGNPYMSSMTNGLSNNSTMYRGTVHNVSGTLNITGGTFIGLKQQALSNEATLTIGTDDGNIDGTTPVFIGEKNGICSTQPFDFYDGIAKGKINAIDGTVIDHNDGTQVGSGTEVIDGDTYYTAFKEVTS